MLWPQALMVVTVVTLGCGPGAASSPMDTYPEAGGVYSGNQTLYFVSSPYKVTRTIFVQAGANLTIEQGVKLHFASGIGIVVQGVLHAVVRMEPRARAPVFFTSTRSCGRCFSSMAKKDVTRSFCRRGCIPNTSFGWRLSFSFPSAVHPCTFHDMVKSHKSVLPSTVPDNGSYAATEAQMHQLLFREA
ncbi:unnamed protein product [Soboliphyme baturini]|uniref:Vitellogenin domain-containing protein n=1 Tax=Soboliphyme baturini TaxID=241478 RepID=A0A183INT5_9BILA|nr:unnamed protein product [Soboliphyme baturini]